MRASDRQKLIGITDGVSARSLMTGIDYYWFAVAACCVILEASCCSPLRLLTDDMYCVLWTMCLCCRNMLQTIYGLIRGVRGCD